MNTNITTIKLSLETKKRLDQFKRYKRETYEEILQNMLGILNLCRFSPERARAHLRALDKAGKQKKEQLDSQEDLLM